MTSCLLDKIRSASCKEEAIMWCDILGERFNEDEYESFSKMKNWEKTLFIYDVECRERNVRNILH